MGIASHTAIAVDRLDGIHLFDVTGQTHWHKPVGGAWQSSAVDAGFSSAQPGIAVDGQGWVHLSYARSDTWFGNKDLVHAALAPGGVWNTRTLDPGGGGDSMLTLGPSEQLHMVYKKDGTVQYSYAAPGGTWTFSTVSDMNQPQNPRIVVDHAGGKHILYGEGATNRLRYAYQP